jgi:hypothetical protein
MVPLQHTLLLRRSSETFTPIFYTLLHSLSKVFLPAHRSLVIDPELHLPTGSSSTFSRFQRRTAPWDLAPKFLLVCFLQQEGKLDDSGDQQQTRQPPPSLSSSFAMFLCCVCDEKRRVTGSSPAAGVCPNCGGGASQVRVLNMFRFCFIPVCCTTHRRLMCTRCGAQLRS